MGEAQHKQYYCRWMELKLLATARKANLNTRRILENYASEEKSRCDSNWQQRFEQI